MTPGELNIPIYRGAKWQFAFQFMITDTETPMDLTGLGPFVCEIRDPRGDRLLATPTVTSDYDDNGTITITISSAQSIVLPLGKVRMGVRDALDNSYLEGMPEVKWFTPHS